MTLLTSVLAPPVAPAAVNENSWPVTVAGSASDPLILPLGTATGVVPVDEAVIVAVDAEIGTTIAQTSTTSPPRTPDGTVIVEEETWLPPLAVAPAVGAIAICQAAPIRSAAGLAGLGQEAAQAIRLYVVIVFEALLVPQAAPTPTARLAVVSTVTVRSACVIGIGTSVTAVSVVP